MLTKMLKKRSNEKGFTLMEMLIVVAIIAILIAIAIPTFNNSLNKAKLATDEANIRSGYAAVAAKVLTDKVEARYHLHAEHRWLH
jgi:prepilin-type N-terminal cleavage/methylation domain-containing protein